MILRTQAALPAGHWDELVGLGQPRGSPFGSKRNVLTWPCKSRANNTNCPEISEQLRARQFVVCVVVNDKTMKTGIQKNEFASSARQNFGGTADLKC